MEVILLERIARLGTIGDVVKVRNGFARNFLIPEKKALRATDANKKVFESKRAEIEATNAQNKQEAEAIASKISGTAITLVRQASQEGKLYGSVAGRDIAEALKEAGHEVPKSQIILSGTIKTTGQFPVRISLHPDVACNITVDVVRLETEAA
jgi:large subunit ribosomal protein L9